MGLDLRLMPFEEGAHFSHMLIDTERRSELYDVILALEEKWGRNVPERFSTFCGHDEKSEETCYGNTQETPYGEPLRYVLADKLAELHEHPAVQDNELNRAAWAFLRELGKTWRVALFWH
jgi:hypothetical protein